jgi:hypothetical protein
VEHYSFLSYHPREERIALAAHDKQSKFFVSTQSRSAFRYMINFFFRRFFKYFYVQLVFYGFNFKFKKKAKILKKIRLRQKRRGIKFKRKFLVDIFIYIFMKKKEKQ